MLSIHHLERKAIPKMNVKYAQTEKNVDEEIKLKLMEALKWFPINYLDSYNNAIIIDFQLFFHHRPKILFLHVAVKWNGLFDAMRDRQHRRKK